MSKRKSNILGKMDHKWPILGSFIQNRKIDITSVWIMQNRQMRHHFDGLNDMNHKTLWKFNFFFQKVNGYKWHIWSKLEKYESGQICPRNGGVTK